MSSRNKNIAATLHRSNIARNIKGLLILIGLTVLVAGTSMSFVHLPTFGIMMQTHRFYNEDFDQIDVYGITDGNGTIQIVDDAYKTVYPADADNAYSADDVNSMVHILSTYAPIRRYSYVRDGQLYTQIISGSHDNGWYLTVDEDLHYVDSANFHFIQPSYTGADLDYVENDYVKDARVYRYPFVSKHGRHYTMIVQYDGPIRLLEAYEIWIIVGMIALLIAVYVFYIIRSVRSVSRRFKIPIIQLNKAMKQYAQGNQITLPPHYAIAEFNQIVATYNQMVARLEQLKQSNQQLADDKKALIANISHDLKTPITAVQGYIDALRNGRVPTDQQGEYLDRIYQRVDVLTTMINTFAEYNKLDYPNFQLSPAPTDVTECLRGTISAHYNQIIDSGMTVDVDLPDHPVTASLDTLHFNRCIDNILSNFVKYNPPKTAIHVMLTTAGDQIHIRLSNNGTLIDPAIADTLFDPLVKGDPARNSQGSGLGLAITRKIIHLHHGQITYRAADGWNVFEIGLGRENG